MTDTTETPADEKPARRRRDHGRPIKVLVTDDERAELVRLAGVAGRPVSSYLRAVGLGHPVTNAFDHAAVRELVKVSGDLGRFGGLLKLWLSERKGDGARAVDVNRLLKETREIQEDIRERLRRL